MSDTINEQIRSTIIAIFLSCLKSKQKEGFKNVYLEFQCMLFLFHLFTYMYVVVVAIGLESDKFKSITVKSNL